ncbi:Uncharacterised protein [Bordetella pertussis]|nr:Uncharacterised protein [Bordetella pertussis]CFV96023.1 Uncharacterised protein [Bordetella pertussis]
MVPVLPATSLRLSVARARAAVPLVATPRSISSMTKAVRASMARAAASPAMTGRDCIRTLPELSVTRSIR